MPGKPRCHGSIAILWLCFLLKLLYYASFVPLWEGYDEFSHFAFAQTLAVTHEFPDLRQASISRELAESLRLAPVPWTIRNWTPGWTTEDDFWRLPEVSRQQRVRELWQIPQSLAREPAPALRLYEAQQPPLAYLLYAIPSLSFAHASLAARVWILRLTGAAIASLMIPLAFMSARRIFQNESLAVGVVALIVSMPGLMMTTDHGGNEPLAIVLATACFYLLVSLVPPGPQGRPRNDLRSLPLGVVLGCGLLTKAYFLTLIPATLVIFLTLWWMDRQTRPARLPVQLLIVIPTAIAVAGWWYWRAFHATGSFTGDQVSIAARASSVPILTTLRAIGWRGVADFALFSHVWLGGWSFLVLRSWMYRVVEAVLLAAVAGLVIRCKRRTLTRGIAMCIVLEIFFCAGLAYYALETYRATGEAAVLGYYAYALVVPEAVCIFAGLSALLPAASARFILPALVAFFAAAEVYGTVFCLMPYYAGLTMHTAQGTVPALHLTQLSRAVAGESGAEKLFRHLAVNKPDFLSPAVLCALFACFLLAIAATVFVSVYSSLFGQRGKT
jgi:hypothetical protein